MEHQGLPDTPTAGSCAPASPADVAACLEEAADRLLIQGRCRDASVGPAGEECVLASIATAARSAGFNQWDMYDQARSAVNDHLGHEFPHDPNSGIVLWNEYTDDDDEVRDTLLLVAKDLRNTAVPV